MKTQGIAASSKATTHSTRDDDDDDARRWRRRARGRHAATVCGDLEQILTYPNEVRLSFAFTFAADARNTQQSKHTHTQPAGSLLFTERDTMRIMLSVFYTLVKKRECVRACLRFLFMDGCMRVCIYSVYNAVPLRVLFASARARECAPFKRLATRQAQTTAPVRPVLLVHALAIDEMHKEANVHLEQSERQRWWQ